MQRFGAHPDLPESLRMLIVEQRYSITDVGYMYGVSRERVRQWCVRLGIAAPHTNRLRVWNDVTNEFEPHKRSDFACAKARVRAIHKAKLRGEKFAQREAYVTTIVRELAIKHKRVPTSTDIVWAMFGDDNSGHLSGYLGTRNKTRHDTFVAVMSRIYVAAGIHNHPYNK